MPLIENSSYDPSFFFKNRHCNTIYPSLFRKVEGVQYRRERMNTPDGDFLDLDWSTMGGNKLVIVLHGLEGNADRAYIRGIVKAMNLAGWDGMGINFRGCSGAPNLAARSYHSGETEDLDWVIQAIQKKNKYQQIALVGFSLGGNVAFKYAGERGNNLASEISHVVAFSVPCDLESCSHELDKWHNWIYLNRFLVTLKEKVVEKKDILAGKVDLERVRKANSFFEFDDAVTAPIHGFAGALDYWRKSSCKQFLSQLSINALMINARDDSFLSEECYPTKIAADSTKFTLEIPPNGGHVGFYSPDKNGLYWSDRRMAQFILERE
ncbi:MAG: alpha/beta fold hydrolase [Bacteroidota bacterium]